MYVLLQKPPLIGVIMWVLGVVGVDHQWLFVLLVRSFWVRWPLSTTLIHSHMASTVRSY